MLTFDTSLDYNKIRHCVLAKFRSLTLQRIDFYSS